MGDRTRRPWGGKATGLLTYTEDGRMWAALMATDRPDVPTRTLSAAPPLMRAAAAAAYRQFVNHHQVGPVIGELMRTADDIVDRTFDRFVGRLGRGDDRAVLRQTAHTVARTMLAGPVAYLKQADREPEVVDAIADAFGLDDD